MQDPQMVGLLSTSGEHMDDNLTLLQQLVGPTEREEVVLGWNTQIRSIGTA